jgi:hypothetical protein
MTSFPQAICMAVIHSIGNQQRIFIDCTARLSVMAAYLRLQQRLRESCGVGEGRVARDARVLTDAPNFCRKPAKLLLYPVRSEPGARPIARGGYFVCLQPQNATRLFLQSGPASERTPSPHRIHRKTAAFSINHIDTNRQSLAPLR